MGTSLSGLTPATTFDGLLKVGDNDPLTADLKAISDGSGNDSAIQLSTGELKVLGQFNVDTDTALTSINLRGDALNINQIYQANETTYNSIAMVNSGGIQFKNFANVVAVIRENKFAVGLSTTPLATAHIKGSGATSATSSLLVQNSDGTASLTYDDAGKVEILGNSQTGFIQTYAFGAVGFGNESGPTIIYGKLGGGILNAGMHTGSGYTAFGANSSSSQRVLIKGSGNDNTTTALSVQNSGGETMFSVRDDKTIQMDGSRFNFNSSAFTSYADILLNTDLAVGTTTIAANTRAHIKGSGNDATTAALLVQNSDGTSMFRVKDSGYVDINPANSSGGSLQVRGDGTDHLIFANANDNYVGIGGTTQSSSSVRAYIKGKGATSATNALLVQNSAGTELFKVTDDGSVISNGGGSLSANTAFGGGALVSNTTAIRNTAIGNDTLSLNTTAGENTAVGFQSLRASLQGVANTAIGSQSLAQAQYAGYNVAIGTDSLRTNTTGDSNTAIGTATNSGNFSGSVILGRSATATADNQFVVGSLTTNAGTVANIADPTPTHTWEVLINGVKYKVLLQEVAP